MSPAYVQWIAAALFALAPLHTFAAKLSSRFLAAPRSLNLLGEVESEVVYEFGPSF
jgi:hypothetical protein